MLNEAINCYTHAINLDPENAVYPANRAMCLIKQEKYRKLIKPTQFPFKISPYNYNSKTVL